MTRRSGSMACALYGPPTTRSRFCENTARARAWTIGTRSGTSSSGQRPKTSCAPQSRDFGNGPRVGAAYRARWSLDPEALQDMSFAGPRASRPADDRNAPATGPRAALRRVLALSKGSPTQLSPRQVVRLDQSTSVEDRGPQCPTSNKSVLHLRPFKGRSAQVADFP